MKPYPAGLDTLLATGTFVYCDLYDFTLWDSSHVRYATSDTDVFYGGNTYTSKGPYFDTVASKSLGHWKAGLDLDAWIVQLAPTSADPITGTTFPATLFNQPWLAAVRAGALRGASVDIHRAYWSTWPQPWASPLVTVKNYLVDPISIVGSASWVTGFASDASVASPVSSSQATRLTEDTSNNAHNLVQSVDKTTATSKRVALTFYVKKATGTRSIEVLIADGAGEQIAAIFDPAAGTFSGLGGSATWIADGASIGSDFIATGSAGNGWYKCSLWGRTSTLGSTNLLVLFYLYNGGASYIGDGVSNVDIWNPVFDYGYGLASTPGYTLGDIFAGRVAEIDVTRSDATVTINSFVEILSRPMPRNLYQAPCRWTLFDAGCAIADTSFKASGTVLAVLAQNAITSSGIATLGNVDGYYALGRLLWLTGSNVGFPLAIRNSQVSNGTLEFIRPAPFPIAVGDTFTAYAGCDKTQATCTNKFSNKVNFGGFPYVPQAETGV